MDNQLAVREDTLPAPLSARDVVAQVQVIQQVMKACMKEGEHYGTIPGCGDKKVLLKSGAEKLAMTFRLSPTFDVKQTDLPSGHREYQVICTLHSIKTGAVLGQGVGCCSSMEGKYRFRGGEKKPTDTPVPKEYWNLRNAGKKQEAQALIGGEGFGTVKHDGQWVVAEIGEKMENDNPADTFNTVLKMAKKRAQVDATLTVCAASDLFTQDLEETQPEPQADHAPTAAETPAPARQTAPPAPDKPAPTKAASRSSGGGDLEYFKYTPEKPLVIPHSKWKGIDPVPSCTYGRNEGVMWQNMTEKQLYWYWSEASKNLGGKFERNAIAQLMGIQDALVAMGHGEHIEFAGE